MMRFFRSHIVRYSVLLLIASGLLPSFSTAESAEKETDEFAQWLAQFAKEGAEEQARSKISELETSDDLLREASRMVRSNTEWFALPVNKNSDTPDEDVYSVIKSEWMAYKQSSTLGSEKAIERQHRPVWASEKLPMMTDFRGIPSGDILTGTGVNGVHSCLLAEATADEPDITSGIAIRGP